MPNSFAASDIGRRVTGDVLLGQDREPQVGQPAAHVLDGHEVQVLGLEPGQPHLWT